MARMPQPRLWLPRPVHLYQVVRTWLPLPQVIRYIGLSSHRGQVRMPDSMARVTSTTGPR